MIQFLKNRVARSIIIFISNLFVLEHLTAARWLRKMFLQLAGVKFSRGDFFADRGLKVLFPQRLRFGENVSLGHDNNFWCFSDVSIGSWTQTAKDLLIISGSHNNSSYAPLSGEQQAVVIGPGCWIGARVTILGGTRLGPGSIVAAGAVVTGEFPPLSIIGGVPARLIKTRVPASRILSPFGEYSFSEICRTDTRLSGFD